MATQQKRKFHECKFTNCDYKSRIDNLRRHAKNTHNWTHDTVCSCCSPHQIQVDGENIIDVKKVNLSVALEISTMKDGTISYHHDKIQIDEKEFVLIPAEAIEPINESVEPSHQYLSVTSTNDVQLMSGKFVQLMFYFK